MGLRVDGRVVLLLIVVSLAMACVFGDPFSDWGDLDDVRRNVASAR